VRLTEEQKNVIKSVIKLEKPVQIVSGYAGTGKTCVIQHLHHLLPNFAVCAYTGKAANVLRKKGIPSKTIHSLIYKAYTDENNKVYFSLAYSLDCEGIIVDEASMVSEHIYKDLLSFGKPLIFVGDHGQLEPIGDKFNLMNQSDFRLETIHRNAGEIAHFAEYIRKGYKPCSWEIRNGVGEKIKFVPKNAYKDIATQVDQTICAFNKTRAEVNYYVRNSLERKQDPEEGDRVMCLKNNSLLGLFNGMQGFVNQIFEDDIMVFDSDGNSFCVPFDRNVFGQIKYDFDGESDAPIPFDYCYAVTCHKSQGSEYDSVLVLEQRCDLWDHRRWAYTAASRAREKLYWCEMGR
jgi:ATP-dependent exoDNAse (exonuclease V) alpha subunit